MDLTHGEASLEVKESLFFQSTCLNWIDFISWDFTESTALSFYKQKYYLINQQYKIIVNSNTANITKAISWGEFRVIWRILPLMLIEKNGPNHPEITIWLLLKFMSEAASKP